MTSLADGNLCAQEQALFERLEVALQLGLVPADFQRVLRETCEDLLSTVHSSWSQSCNVGQIPLQALMADIDDPALQQRLLGLCRAVAEADGHVADGEAVLLDIAFQQWAPQRRPA
jgi:tellurite resistance protein